MKRLVIIIVLCLFALNHLRKRALLRSEAKNGYSDDPDYFWGHEIDRANFGAYYRPGHA